MKDYIMKKLQKLKHTKPVIVSDSTYTLHSRQCYTPCPILGTLELSNCDPINGTSLREVLIKFAGPATERRISSTPRVCTSNTQSWL